MAKVVEDYKKLYEVQDKILKIISSLDNDFYLTGGTAIHRFHYNFRYSDDLDFFATNDDFFSENFKEFLGYLKNNRIEYNHEVKARDFHRVFVDDILQIDFVNDKVYRYGKSCLIDGYKIDNKINILTNKVSTVINRDEEKDIFDLFSFCFNENFNWKEILEIANKKAHIETEVFAHRLKTFPLSWLKRIKVIKTIDINSKNMSILIDDILNSRENSLYKGV